mmetsp:Transcript_19772/g.36412  ORF Transcript_19772/g.36412 Transcript_19772/m.36412 type:complete len:276 (-) Transcript_19772:1401-2228(-)
MKKQDTYKRSLTIGTLAPSLPKNFAEMVLDLECELDASWQNDTVQQLMELYTQAIEYYCTIASPKFKLFQERLQSLLLRQDERNQAQTQFVNEPSPRLSNVHLPNSFNVPKTPRKDEQQGEVREKANVDKILFAAETVSVDSGHALKECLDAQKTTLDERLQARKAGRKSLKPKLSECDRGGGLALDDVLEEKLQKLNASLAIEKAQKVATLKQKFDASIDEFLQMPKSDTIDQIIERIKESMQVELADVDAEFEDKRQRETAVLKEGLSRNVSR